MRTQLSLGGTQGAEVRIWDVTSPWGRESWLCCLRHLFQFRGSLEVGPQLLEGRLVPGRHGVGAVGAGNSSRWSDPVLIMTPQVHLRREGAVPISQDCGARTEIPFSGQRKIRNGP